MLQVSEKARTVLEWVRAHEKLPETFGVRISIEADSQGNQSISLSWAREPQEEDQVIRQLGTEIYVAPDVAEQLSESIIDLEETPQGPDLVIRPQPRSQPEGETG